MAAHENKGLSNGEIAVTTKNNGLPQISNAPTELKALTRDVLIEVYRDYVNSNYCVSQQSHILLILTD